VGWDLSVSLKSGPQTGRSVRISRLVVDELTKEKR